MAQVREPQEMAMLMIYFQAVRKARAEIEVKNDKAHACPQLPFRLFGRAAVLSRCITFARFNANGLLRLAGTLALPDQCFPTERCFWFPYSLQSMAYSLFLCGSRGRSPSRWLTAKAHRNREK